MNLPKPTSAPSSAVDVLIVDDQAPLCRVLARALRRQGASTSVASSTLHAIRALEAQLHWVVVSDLNMPGPDGGELLRTVEARWPSSRRVLFSGYVDSGVVLAAPAHRYVDKSLPLSLVVEIVLEELARAHQPRP